MRQSTKVVAFLLIVLALAVGMASAQDGAEQVYPLEPVIVADSGGMFDETPDMWFVELAGAPVADGGRQANLAREKAAFRQEARQVGLQYSERMVFDTLWNGLSVVMSPSELSKIANMRSVKAVYPVATIAIPETSPLSSPELATALAMTGADIAQSELGYTGEGIRVAVMDTGIDYDHADLGGDGVARTDSTVFPTDRVVAGWDFVGNDFNADRTSPFYNPEPMPDPYPDDCHGHGTHVAGIVGASGDPAEGGALGVAPGVTFGAYRVFGCGGSTTADIMIAAMERALADDMDVLNMSIGSAFNTWPQYPTAAASDRLVNKGMVVVASIGNSGASGVYSAGAPGVGNKVIGVASYDNSHVALRVFTISPDDTQIGYGVAAAAPQPPTEGTYPMARTGTAASTADACEPLAPGSLDGHVALIRRGGCTFHLKSLNAQNAGAEAVVLYNNLPGRFSPTVTGEPPITIPVVAISDSEGVLIDSRLASGPVDMTWTDETGMFANPTGGLISSFSSFGLGAELALKPDIGAPGGLIRSTYPLENGGYATISGTSMSAPHVAGSVALLLEAAPNTPAMMAGDMLQNSAEPKNWWGNPGLGFLDNVHRQGAGMVQIDKAILATTKITPGKLSLGESEAGATTHALTIENKGGEAVTYDLSYVNALSTGGSTFDPGYFVGSAAVTFSSPIVTVPAGGSATVEATVHPAAGPALGQYGGYIVFTPQDGGQVYRVPYAGFVGDYQAIEVLTGNFPQVGRATACVRIVEGECIGGNYTIPGDGYVYDMSSVFEQPSFLVHLDHQARRLRAQVFDANTGRSWHRAFDFEYLARNSGPTSFFAFGWDGTTSAGNRGYEVPNGQYVIELSVLKALGDSDNPAHWETWTSPVITIERP